MNRITTSAERVACYAKQGKRIGRVIMLVLLSALCLSITVAAQGDPARDQQQDGQAQPIDFAAEIEALKRDIEEIKAQLARITALQRLQSEELLRQGNTAPVAPAVSATPAAPQNPRNSRPQPAAPAANPAPSTAGETPTVFVFKDGTRTEAHNFAIVGGTLWIYTDQEAKKYAVSYIDVAASTAANASRGNKFQMPESR